MFLSDWDFALVCFKPDGTAYTSFGSGGKVTTAAGSYYDISGGLGIQSGGKIVVARCSLKGLRP